MKKLLLAFAMLAAMATAAMAESKTPGGPMESAGGDNSTDTQGVSQIVGPAPEPDLVVRPVPEPGTMALASMGLIALGAAARKRRQK
ncbi:MAG: PEP-CTERM sorting domain-containing protein [Candidatus Eisenbacteria bacterium]